MLVCHTCDNPPCVNPAHLYAGTARDNAVDRDTRHRNGQAKIGPRDVRAMRQRCARGEPQCSVATEYGLSRPQMSRIIARKRWGHVP